MKGKKILLLFVTGIALASCTKEELRPAPDKVDVTVRLHWGALPVAGGMNYCFYPTGGGAAVTEEGSGEAYQGALPSGGYRVLAYNTGTEGIAFTGMESYGTATAEVLPVSASTRADGLTLVSQASMLYAVTGSDELVVPRLDPVETGANVKRLTRSLRLTFKLSDTQGISSLEGTFNGVYPSLLLSTGEPGSIARSSAPQTAASFTAAVTSREFVVGVSLFGMKNPENGAAYRSTLRLSLKGGDGWRQDVDVDLTRALTDIFAAGGEEPAFEIPTAIDIRVEPTPVGFSASVEGWRLGEGSGEIKYGYYQD
ncbi:DUF5119 domain-containing protein [Bacteroides sp.]